MIDAKLWIDAAIQSSQRSRRILLVLQTFTLLVVVCVLNSCPSGWVPKRIQIAQNARLLFACAPNEPFLVRTTAPEDILVANVEDSRFAVDTWVTSCETTPAIRQAHVQHDELEQAAQWILMYRFSKVDVQKRYEALLKFTDDNVMSVPVPFTSIRVDVNDLGLLTGLAVLFLMAWLFLSLSREATNYNLVLRHTGEQREAFRELLAAHGLFLPAREGGTLSMLLILVSGFVLPISLNLFIVIYDSVTSGVAAFLGANRVGFALWSEGLVAMVTCVVTGAAAWRYFELVRQLNVTDTQQKDT